MKKARQQPTNESQYWDKKLLEAEEKDPNRWKHSGYKKMYVNGQSPEEREYNRNRYNGGGGGGGGGSSNVARNNKSSRSRSPVRRMIPVSPKRHIPRSPPPRYAARRTPPRNELKGKETSYRPTKRPISPPPKVSFSTKSSSLNGANCTNFFQVRSPSITSCSDDSCSVCSSDDGRRMISKHGRMPEGRHGPANRIIPVSPDTDRVPHKKNKLKEVSPKRHKKKRPVSPPVPEKSRRVAEPSTPTKKSKEKMEKRTRVKIEGEKRRNRSPSTASEDSTSSESSFPAMTATTKMTLSERFGKMAKWNQDRKYDMGNMKITKNSEGGDMKVMIQEGIRESPVRPRYSPAPEGHYPEELLAHASAQAMGLNAWDDVRVRFDYYKSKGFLRDLTLADYVKWEEWWFKYQVS